MSPVNQKLNLQDIMETALSALDTRSQDVVMRRYGLKTHQPETLESIGQEYGITRERVRQIQSQAVKTLREQEETLLAVADFLEQLFVEHGGIFETNHLVTCVGECLDNEHPQTTITFFLDVLEPYQHLTRDKYFGPHWRHPEAVNDIAVPIVEIAQEYLEKTSHPVSEQDLLRAIQAKVQQKWQRQAKNNHVFAYLKASRHIAETSFSEWGLSDWSETNPRGVGDKAYVVLRRHSKPEHFTRITELINEAAFDHKVANPQTVHNELIKDSRFVLVGRGLYGLTEWGYVPGTVADVIESLLKEATEPMTREEVVEGVLEQRQVKKNTILLGLQNQERFVRTPENRYTLRSR